MVSDALVVVELEIPDEVAVPVELLDPPPLAGAAEEPLAVVERGGAEEMAVLEEVGLLARGVLAFPGADDPPLHVDQVGLLRVQRRDQGIALEGLRVVELEAELGGAICFGVASPFCGAARRRAPPRPRRSPASRRPSQRRRLRGGRFAQGPTSWG